MLCMTGTTFTFSISRETVLAVRCPLYFLNPVDNKKKGEVDLVFWAVCLFNRNGTDRVRVLFCH